MLARGGLDIMRHRRFSHSATFACPARPSLPNAVQASARAVPVLGSGQDGLGLRSAMRLLRWLSGPGRVPQESWWRIGAAVAAGVLAAGTVAVGVGSAAA